MAISARSREIWEKIQENHRKLDSCDRHLFIPEDMQVKLGMRCTCSKCGGTMQLHEVGHYIDGYIAGGGKADDIWPGYETKRHPQPPNQ